MVIFERDGRRLMLSPSAKTILELSESVLDTCSAIYREASLPLGGQTVRLGLTELASSLYLKPIVDRIAQLGREVIVQPIIGLNDALVTMIRQNQLDIVICPSLPTKPGEFRRIPIGASQSQWLCQPELATVDRPVSLAELAALPLILQPASMAFHQAVISHFERHGLRPARIVTCDTLAGLRDFAVAGLGVAPLPVNFCQEQLKTGQLKVLGAEYIPPASDYAIFSNRASSKRDIEWLPLAIAESIAAPSL